MAVQFKVPKSPSRDIAATDTFMGVDLTNTGANIDGIRSPHAPNMVRLVPGKVRKRMGYYKEVLFGTKTNVNFAKDTSAKEKEIIITSDETATWVKIYDLIQTLSCGSSAPLYLDFDYKSEDTFNIVNSTVEVTASEEWEHISTTVYFTEDTDVADIKIFSDNSQEIYIKNFSAMVERTEDYEWSPAPNYFVERETNDPVYGAHFLRRNGESYEGDRVTNVNRVLNTSDEYAEFYLEYGVETEIYDVADDKLKAGTKLTIDFDYEIPDFMVEDILVHCLGHGIGRIRSQSGHISSTINIQDKETISSTAISMVLDETNSTTILIKNCTAVYNKDENYKWSPAPEDNGETFHIEDLTDVGTKNYATKTSGSSTASSQTSYRTYFSPYNSSDDERPDGLVHVSFDLTTSNTGTVNLKEVRVWFSTFQDTSNLCYYKSSTNITETLHVDAYVERATSINVHWQLNSAPSGSPTFTMNVSNFVINKYSVRRSFLYSSRTYLYHVGKDFYIRDDGTSNFDKVYEDANERISRSFQLNNKCYIIDGKDIYQYSLDGGESVEVINQDNAYIPTVTKGKEPSGGGTPYDALNLLQPGFEETFYGNGSDKTFQLSFEGLDATTVKAWTLNNSGDWVAKTENTDFTVNRTTGKITFTSAPGNSPVEGEPNVRIQAYRTIPDYRDRITKCTVGTLFGIGGDTNRIFLAGNPDHPNWDFYCQFNDPTYFPDIAYSVLGSEQSMIKGYAVISNYLATFKDGFDQSQSVFIREGDMLKLSEEETATSEPVFKLINTLQGEGVAASYSFGYLQTEPVFLTKAGIYAITEQDITGEKYSQNRSFYLDGKLRKEDNLENAIATVYDNQYILALNGKLYVLDGLQATRTDKSEPYATRQYAGFLCEGIPATCLWTDDAVCFGTNDGKVCKFYTDVDSLSSYNDDGKAIYSCWETPDLDGKLFYKNKTFRYMAVRLMAAIKTSVKLYSRRFGIWTLNDESAWTFIKSQNAIGTSLDFNNLDFNLFSFSADTTERVIHTKLRVKKVDKARFRVENGELDEPFGIFDLALEYIESGNYKG